jgi:hypothetical protein
MEANIMRLRWMSVVFLGLGVALASCGSDDSSADDECTVGTADGCAAGEICETVADEPVCVAPVAIEGRIFDLATDEGIEGARIVALDANGAARSGVTTSGADGAYSLDIRIPRDDEGNPIGESVSLRVSAQGYQAFPKLPRPSIPVDLGIATLNEDEDAWIVRSAATDVGLIALEGDVDTLGSISGHIERAEDFEVAIGGVLVVAEAGDEAVSSGVTDADGQFVLFNVPAGDVVVTGYAAGMSLSDESVTVVAMERTEDVVLVASGEGLSTVTGTVEIVATDGDNVTSVILVVESTLEELLPGNQAFVRGEAPLGLRAGEVSTDFAIEGVPPGRYAVLAGFENDGLTRDPDEGIAGTDVVFIEVTGDGGVVEAGNFKVTQAIEIFEPGATQMDVIDDPTPTFVFANMPSISHYELRVFNAFGELVHEALNVPDPAGGETVEHTYAGDPLEDGMIYQFRVLAVALVSLDYRNATEDLLGVFQYDPTPPAEEVAAE